MRIPIKKLDLCRLCGSGDLKCVLEFKPTPIADDYISAAKLDEKQETFPLDVNLCRECGHLQLFHAIDPEVLYKDFKYVTSSSPGLVKYFERYAKEILKTVEPTKGSLVVDIGSNDGSLLKFFKVKGMNVLGIDPAYDTALKATDEGVKTIPGYFNMNLSKKLEEEYGKATIITANHTFANIDSLSNVIEGINHLLCSNGVFVFETLYLPDIIQKNLFEHIYHEHLHYFSVKPLEIFFRQFNLELIQVNRVSAKGASFRGFVQKSGGNRPISPTVKIFSALEEEMELKTLDTYRTFSHKLNRTKKKLLSILNTIKENGQTIVGYGASHSVTTLIYQFELTNLLSFLVDDNPRKFDLFSPGAHIPVYSSSKIYKIEPDYVLILAWRYSNQIIERNKKYLNSGGHFIKPLPSIEIIGKSKLRINDGR